MSQFAEPLQPGHEETIHAAPVTGQRLNIARWQNGLLKPPHFLGRYGHATDRGARFQQRLNLIRALFRLQRADTVNQYSAGRQHRHGSFQQLPLNIGQCRDISGAFVMQNIRMPAQGAGGGAGGIQQNGGWQDLGLKILSPLDHYLCREVKPLKIFTEPRQSFRRMIHRRHGISGGGQLRRFATGCGTKVNDC